MKTIYELNQKKWYRLLKVLYVFFFIIFLIVPVLIIISDNKPQSISYKTRGFTAEELLSMGAIPKSDNNNLSFASKIRPVQPLEKTIEEQKTQRRKALTETILYSLISITITITVFEIMKRTFYYIFLGFIFPKRH